MNIRQVHLDLASGKQRQRIAKRHRAMRQPGGVDDDPVDLARCLLDRRYDVRLAVAVYPFKAGAFGLTDGAMAPPW